MLVMTKIHSTKKRKRLKDKRTTFLIGKKENLSTKDLAKEIIKLRSNFYENFENANLIVRGDGVPTELKI